MPEYKTVALDPDVYDLLTELANYDGRTIGKEAATLIRQEIERRSQQQMPLPMVVPGDEVKQLALGAHLTSSNIQADIDKILMGGRE